MTSLQGGPGRGDFLVAENARGRQDLRSGARRNSAAQKSPLPGSPALPCLLLIALTGQRSSASHRAPESRPYRLNNQLRSVKIALIRRQVTIGK
jgi:hypothetical protein